MKKDISRWLRDQWANSTVRFPLLVLAYLIIGGLLLEYSVSFASNGEIRAASQWTARLADSLLGLVTDQTSVIGQLVSFGDFSVRVVFECLGPYEMVIFSAIVLAYPASWTARAWGLFLGPFIIYVFNVVRIVGLLTLGRFQPEMFEFFHVYVWQASLIAMIAVTWLAWIRMFVYR